MGISDKIRVALSPLYLVAGVNILVRGWRVLDIMSTTQANEHKLTPFAKVNGIQIIYPAEQPWLFAAEGAGGSEGTE